MSWEADYTVVTWTCEGCGKKESGEPVFPPEGWGSVEGQLNTRYRYFRIDIAACSEKCLRLLTLPWFERVLKDDAELQAETDSSNIGEAGKI